MNALICPNSPLKSWVSFSFEMLSNFQHADNLLGHRRLKLKRNKKILTDMIPHSFLAIIYLDLLQHTYKRIFAFLKTPATYIPIHVTSLTLKSYRNQSETQGSLTFHNKLIAGGELIYTGSRSQPWIDYLNQSGNGQWKSSLYKLETQLSYIRKIKNKIAYRTMFRRKRNIVSLICKHIPETPDRKHMYRNWNVSDVSNWSVVYVKGNSERRICQLLNAYLWVVGREL